MMEGSKQEKYVLLDDESDEEFDKSKEALMKSLDGKKYIRRPRNRSTLMQPQWLCQTLCMVLLVAAQGVLSFFILRMFWDLEAIKQRHSGIFRNGASQGSIFTELTNVSLEEQLEYGLEHLNYSQIDEDLNSRASHTRNVSLVQRVKLLEIKIKLLERIVSSQNSNQKILQSQHSHERIKLSEDVKMTALETKLNNVSEALNTLQKRMEEGLDATLLQISHLKDDFYFMENFFNHTDREHLGSYPSNSLPSKEMTKVPDIKVHPSAASKEDSTFHENTTAVRPTKLQKTSGGKHKIRVPLIKNHADFQVFFYGADKDANGYLTYPELVKVLGEDAPKKEELQKFDEDDNKMYSYLELMKTFELSD